VPTLDHLALACRDPDRSLAFYRDVVGVEGDVRAEPYGFVISTPSGVNFTLLHGEPPPAMGDFHLGLSMADPDAVRAARERFRSLGHTEYEWWDEDDYTSVKIVDPDGYIVEVSWEGVPPPADPR
jgi:catechol 2,3-dioxygenase-like lactoylglutathione lyase family enzyme